MPLLVGIKFVCVFCIAGYFTTFIEDHILVASFIMIHKPLMMKVKLTCMRSLRLLYIKGSVYFLKNYQLYFLKTKKIMNSSINVFMNIMMWLMKFS